MIVVLEETPSDSFSHKHAGSRLAIGRGLSFRVGKEKLFLIYAYDEISISNKTMTSSCSEVMQRAGDAQISLARELAEYEMHVERDVLAPMSSLLEVISFFYVPYWWIQDFHGNNNFIEIACVPDVLFLPDM